MNLTLMEYSNLSGPLAFSPLPLRETESQRARAVAPLIVSYSHALSLSLSFSFLFLPLVGFLVHVAWGKRGVGVGVGGVRGTFALAN